MTPAQIRARATEIREQEIPINLQLNEQILKTWEALRPVMWRRLAMSKTAEDLALVVQVAMWDAVEAYERAGMPPTDAREQAEREWLMMEPEAEETPEAEKET